MRISNDIRPDAEWVDDSGDAFAEMELMDDELLFSDFDDVDNQPADPADSKESVPLWRIIEMSREDRFLKYELADFEDYDELEDFDGYAAGEFSH